MLSGYTLTDINGQDEIVIERVGYAIFRYSGDHLGAVRYEDFKIHLKPAHGGLPGIDFYNVMRDPGEKYGKPYPGLFAVAPLQDYIKNHMMTVRRFPHRQSETMPKGAEITPHD